jgi:hypothetical protein
VPRFEVYATRVAERQLRELQGDVRRRAKEAMDALEDRGCEAADWRLDGPEVERCCVVNLGRDWRMNVAFPSLTDVVVLLVARHIDRRPEIDVYRQLYTSIGIELPTAVDRVGHPPCCPTGEPPLDADSVDRFIHRTKELGREQRGRGRRSSP